MELSLLCNTGDRIFGGSALNVSTDHADLTHLYYMQDTSNMLTRWAIALQGFDFTVEHKPGKLRVVPDTLPRLFGDIPEDTTQGKKSLSEVFCRRNPSWPLFVVMYPRMSNRMTHHPHVLMRCIQII